MTGKKYKIEKNVPVKAPAHPGRGGKYPFREMVAGDSIFFDDAKEGKKAYCAARVFSYRDRSFKFSGVAEHNGFRVWRIA